MLLHSNSPVCILLQQGLRQQNTACKLPLAPAGFPSHVTLTGGFSFVTRELHFLTKTEQPSCRAVQEPHHSQGHALREGQLEPVARRAEDAPDALGVERVGLGVARAAESSSLRVEGAPAGCSERETAQP